MPPQSCSPSFASRLIRSTALPACSAVFAWLMLREKRARAEAERLASELAASKDELRAYLDQIGARTRELGTLLEVAHTVNSTLEIKPLLRLILDRLKTIVDYSGAAIFELEDSGQLRLVHYQGPIPQDELRLTWNLEHEPVNARVVQSRQPLLIPDIHADTPVAHDFRVSTGHYTRHMRSWMGIPLIARQRVIGMLSFDHLQTGFYTPKHAELGLAFANQVALALENAHFYHAEQERRREADQRRRVAEGLRDMLNTLNSNRPLRDILAAIMDQACSLLNTQAAAVYRLDEAGQTLTIQAARGLSEDFFERMATPVGRGYVGKVVQTGRPIILMDTSEVVSTYDLIDEPGRRELVLRLVEQFKAAIVAPLFIHDRIYGSILLLYSDKQRFSGEELELVNAFCDQAALAIENARLREEIETAAVSAERQRLARDLHDAVTQTLFSASLIAEVLPRLYEANPDEGQKKLSDLRRLTRGALAEMRTLLMELRPAALTETPFTDLLRQLIEAATGRTRLEVSLAANGEGVLPPDVQTNLYRIVQESLNNVVRHARATSLTVLLDYHQTWAKLQICDDGRGFDPAAVPPDHYGLRIMRERAASVGALVAVDSEPGQGTRVSILWPEGGTTS